MLSYMHRAEMKWFLIGLVVGIAVGYAQGSGMMDLLALLPV
ncbi:MAG: hypothetical protein ABEI07_02810 [Candidatus Nanohaloarchaea archaeon]